ncbi:MAG: hypothetical protein ACOY3P_19155, partial [Planctomycetota bacterium]
MDELKRQVRRAHRRLETQRFLGILGWCWFAAMCVAAILIAFGKFRPLGVADWVWPVAGVVAGLVVATVWLTATRRAPLGAAIEVDRRFGLRERVSSTLALGDEQLQSPVGQALAADAVRRVARVDVSERFRLGLPRHIWLPLLPALLALVIALFVSPAVVENPATAKQQAAVTQKQVKKSAEELRRRIEAKRQLAERQKLEDAQDLFKKIEEEARKLQEAGGDRKEALT